MNAMVVGADKLGNIPDMLTKFGIRITQHVSGRHMAHQRKISGLPKKTDLLILFTDFLGHNVMLNFRNLAREQGVPVVTCRRSASRLAQCVERCLKSERQKCANCSFSR